MARNVRCVSFVRWALSSGWRIVRVTFSKGSHFGHANSVRLGVPVILVQRSQIAHNVSTETYTEKYGGVVVVVLVCGTRHELGVFDHGDLQFHPAI
jgi:adenine/guanine phosphoribosyltransferase-like PRPP-binding protein